MPIARSRTFRSGNSQALRLPKDISFADDADLVLVRAGDVLTVYPAGATIPAMLAALEKLPRVRMGRRDRQALPERRGL